MKAEQIKELDKEYIIGSYGRYDLVCDHGKNATMFDKDGKEYIDFTAGIGVNSLGFADEGWIKAVEEQLHKFQHASNLFYTEPGVELAKKLAERTGMEKVFFCNSGGEANETAFKIAKKYGNTMADHRKNTIISLYDSFHGRTVATITATGQDRFHTECFEPYAQGYDYAAANDLESMKAAVEKNDPCAIIMEIVQGEGGLIGLEKDFVEGVQKICDEKDIILIIDEVQAGIGRTGSFFAYQQYGIHPDIVSFAKGIGAGLPIGGVVCGKKTCDLLVPGEQGCTFGMNPVVCAGANYVMDTMDDEFLAAVCKKAEHLRAELEAIDEVEKTTGLGLMIGVKLKNKKADEVVNELLANGLMTLTAVDKIRLLPPLTISQAELDKGIAIFKKVLG
ncbi:MAG: acetylornithine/succinylornithine family transaminase [Eubacteriaceae bacterium]|jgi:acetylornithine/N-succinyldiaminopimelate aminotransferase|nr:acetylornithine/succinylornithine family transaminase [Eubacteriaceae bacterium]